MVDFRKLGTPRDCQLIIDDVGKMNLRPGETNQIETSHTYTGKQNFCDILLIESMIRVCVCKALG